MSDLRSLIIETDDLLKETLVVSEWGGIEVLVVGMTGAERAQFMAVFRNDDGSVNYEAMYPRLIISTVCDPSNGEKVFAPEDEAVINTKSAAALERIAKVSLRLSGMDNDAEKEAGKDS